MDWNKYERITVYALIAIVGRLLLQWIPGGTPIMPMALYTASFYGLEAAVGVAVIAQFVSGIIISGSFDSFTIIKIVMSTGLVVVSMILSVKILKIGKPGKYEAGALLDKVILATIFLEIGMSLTRGAIFIYPDSFYHLIANILFVGVIALLSKEDPKKKK